MLYLTIGSWFVVLLGLIWVASVLTFFFELSFRWLTDKHPFDWDEYLTYIILEKVADTVGFNNVDFSGIVILWWICYGVICIVSWVIWPIVPIIMIAHLLRFSIRQYRVYSARVRTAAEELQSL